MGDTYIFHELKKSAHELRHQHYQVSRPQKNNHRAKLQRDRKHENILGRAVGNLNANKRSYQRRWEIIIQPN